ncbi:hypothetical protein COU37_03695 [Candidatus Micrarchaeota archaeon CG10_big_fil_rev_8_21_14_0_10_45_29]|nr:MAG: hypothetical protein COU37_03695 [Candidatus Micrarchaeota archaeon CG10_big_fil_rev_8_21_14_0_10_45_29]
MKIKIFAAILLLSPLLFASSGTTTMTWTNSAFFKFSEGKTTPYSNAISAHDDPSAYYDISLEPWDAPAWCANYIDMGEVSLDSLKNPPLSGYNDDNMGFIDCDYVQSGHAYWIKTREGKFAKVKIKNAQHLGTGDDGNINTISFSWEYYENMGISKPPSACPLAVSIISLALFASCACIKR